MLNKKLILINIDIKIPTHINNHIHIDICLY